MHRHDFNVHYCKIKPMFRREWVGDKIVQVEPPEETWLFAVDGGRAYLKRCGEGWIETAVFDTGVKG